MSACQCLIPEIKLTLDGEQGLIEHLERVLESRGHALICIAEGAAQVGSAAAGRQAEWGGGEAGCKCMRRIIFVPFLAQKSLKCKPLTAALVPLLQVLQDMIPEDEYEYESEGDNLKDNMDDKSEVR